MSPCAKEAKNNIISFYTLFLADVVEKEVSKMTTRQMNTRVAVSGRSVAAAHASSAVPHVTASLDALH